MMLVDCSLVIQNSAFLNIFSIHLFWFLIVMPVINYMMGLTFDQLLHSSPSIDSLRAFVNFVILLILLLSCGTV